MTCREKLANEQPDRVCPDFMAGACGCPHHYGYLDRPDYCLSPGCQDESECVECWNREISEEEQKMSIKDSGDRTEFSTGAVRDMREGKGRCDLMPLEVVCGYLEYIGSTDKVLHHLSSFQKSYSTEALYAALECFCTVWWDRSFATMFLEVAKHFEDGAKKYGENNWQKGIPVNCYIDSAIRHYLKWLRGDTDEHHDRAFIWNIMCCIWEVDYRTKEDK